MERFDRQDVQRYLDANFLTLQELSEQAGLAPERVQELVDAQCVPPHSHEARGVAVYASTFGEYTAPLPPERYYHPSLVDWAKKASALARRHSLADVARRMRKDFEAAFEAALDGRAPPWARGVDYAWAYLMDGTWGLCLREISVANILQKEFARQTIARLVSPEPDHALSAEARRTLIAAIESYNEVAAEFGPHERPDSSRVREVGAAIEKYGLADDLAAPRQPLRKAS